MRLNTGMQLAAMAAFGLLLYTTTLAVSTEASPSWPFRSKVFRVTVMGWGFFWKFFL
jgi:hypothetical protein